MHVKCEDDPIICRRAHDAAWRQAVETWPLEHDFLNVLQPKECSPSFNATAFK